METTDDAALGGRLRLLQPKRGHRVGHDAILLAAATAGVAGDHAVDLGAGIGSAGLALAARVPGLRVTLLDIEQPLCDLANENARRNALGDRVQALCCDVESIPALTSAGLREAGADRVLMNPPFNDPKSQQSSPDLERRRAHVAQEGLLSRWLASAGWMLKPGGVLTLIWRAADRDAVVAALTPAFGAIAVMPVLPRPEADPIRILVRAVKGEAGTMKDLPGLVLNDAGGKPSAAAEAVLREAMPLTLDEPAAG